MWVSHETPISFPPSHLTIFGRPWSHTLYLQRANSYQAPRAILLTPLNREDMRPAESSCLFSLKATLSQNTMTSQVATQPDDFQPDNVCFYYPRKNLPLVWSKLKAVILEHVKPRNSPVFLLSIYSPRLHPPKIIRGARQEEIAWLTKGLTVPDLPTFSVGTEK